MWEISLNTKTFKACLNKNYPSKKNDHVIVEPVEMHIKIVLTKRFGHEDFHIIPQAPILIPGSHFPSLNLVFKPYEFLKQGSQAHSRVGESGNETRYSMKNSS